MALHPDFPKSPHEILDPNIRWFPADEALRETSSEKLMPPLVAQLRRKVKEFCDGGYVGASETGKSLLSWWFTRIVGVSPFELNRVQTEVKFDLVFVDESEFGEFKPKSFKQPLEGLATYKNDC